ncbi:MAG TPA: RNA methyltransferase [Acidimicrobiia bacterium]|nr:RNA methyltransferase [Acidimicrobiia bacterium]
MPSTQPEQFATKAQIKRLRALLRERRARDAEGIFVCEGPRVIEAALDRGVELLECYVGVDATDDMHAVAGRVAASGVALRGLDTYAEARVGDTVNPQPVFALAAMQRAGVEALEGADLVVVAARLGDPGNAGTLMRSAAAAGAQVIVLGRGSVDAYNPKVVRASAGACFAVRIVEGRAAVEILEALGAQGVTRLGAAATGGAPPESFDLRAPTALVLGHETEGLDGALPLDATVTLPMAAGESINVAMAGTALVFEAARQRRAPG